MTPIASNFPATLVTPTTAVTVAHLGDKDGALLTWGVTPTKVSWRKIGDASDDLAVLTLDRPIEAAILPIGTVKVGDALEIVRFNAPPIAAQCIGLGTKNARLRAASDIGPDSGSAIVSNGKLVGVLNSRSANLREGNFARLSEYPELQTRGRRSQSQVRRIAIESRA